MKKKYVILIFLMCISAFAQNKETVEEVLKKTEATKSGNFKDIFAGFYQAAFKSISPDGKSLEFNSTLFSIVKNADKDILKTRNRKQIAFLRNFQISANANLENDFSFSGFGAGITWAIINNRDKSFVNFENEEFSKLNDALDEDVILPAITAIVKDSIPLTTDMNAAEKKMAQEKRKRLGRALSAVGTALMNNKTVGDSLKDYYDLLKVKADEIISGNNYRFQGHTVANLKEYVTYTDSLKQAYYTGLEKKALLTFTANGGADTQNKFDRATLGLVYLKGSNTGELDLRATFIYADTTAVSMPRTALNAKAGWNFKVLRSAKENKSVFELKFYGEYNKILRNALPDEDEEKILADADIRIRLTDELWLPFTIKYDTKNSNFLGFLNVTYNFGDN